MAEFHRILLVDDTPTIHADYRKVLGTAPVDDAFAALEASVLGSASAAASTARHAFDLTHVDQGEQALAAVEESLRADRPFSVAFVDMRMPPGWDGLETTRRLRAADPRLQIVICTAYSDHSWAGITAALDPTDNILILKKPFDNIEARQLAHTLCSKWSLERQAESRIAQLDSLARDRGSALAAAEQRFSAAFLGSSQACVIVEIPGGAIIQANSASRLLLDLPAIGDGRPIQHVVPWRDPAPLAIALNQLALGHQADEIELSLAGPARVTRHIRIVPSPFVEEGHTRALLTLNEITQHRRLEEQLRQSQKMEAVGSLAAGIAHDFNNMLTVIQGFTSSARLFADLPPLLDKHLGQVIDAADRAAALTRQLLLFSRRQSTPPIEIDPAHATLGLRSMLTRLLGETIQIEWHCPVGICTIMADISGFEQVVLNLAVNARDAMQPAGGRLVIEVAPVPGGSAELASATSDPALDHVRLRLTDQGCGMSPEVQEHIFEPFFTTKSADRGTGLGLATTYGIVQRHRGWIKVESEAGRGSTFFVYFPRAGAITASSNPPLEIPTASNRRGERILAVEDDASVRDVLFFMLTHLGFKPVMAHDGASALRLWEEHRGRFDLLITDLVMPGGMNGTELALALRRRQPTLPVLIATGYGSDPLPETFATEGFEPILIGKPYDSAMLLAAVERAFASQPVT